MEKLDDWVETNFLSQKTQETRKAGVRAFIRTIYGLPRFKKHYKTDEEKVQLEREYDDAFGRYFAEQRDLLADLTTFVQTIQHRPALTIRSYVTSAKLFFEEQGRTIPEGQWKKWRRRFLPVGDAWTKDRVPTREELRRILNYLDVKGRALVLFLASSGARIGETLQLTEKDMDLESDPPKAIIRPQYTKRKLAGRTIFFSNEAKLAIQDWLKVRKTTGKRAKGLDYSGDRIWDMTQSNARSLWSRAVRKAGLENRDPTTGRKTLHLHSLRKSFRSNVGLDFDLINALMGHRRYLDKSYLRQDLDKAAQQYLVAMKNVSVYTTSRSRKDEIRRALAMQGLTVDEVLSLFRKDMLASGEGMAGGVSRKLPIDENYLCSLEDAEIGKYALKALRRKLLGETQTNGGAPKQRQKIITEEELGEYLARGWLFKAALNNGSGKVIVEKA